MDPASAAGWLGSRGSRAQCSGGIHDPKEQQPFPAARRCPARPAGARQGCARSHLAGGGGAAEDAEVNHEPGQRQAQRLLPLHAAAGLQRRGDVQGLPVPEVLRGWSLLTLLLVARAVAVEGAGGPWQGVLAGRAMSEGMAGRAKVPVGNRQDDDGKDRFLPGLASLCMVGDDPLPWGWSLLTISLGNDPHSKDWGFLILFPGDDPFWTPLPKDRSALSLFLGWPDWFSPQGLSLFNPLPWKWHSPSLYRVTNLSPDIRQAHPRM